VAKVVDFSGFLGMQTLVIPGNFSGVALLYKMTLWIFFGVKIYIKLMKFDVLPNWTGLPKYADLPGDLIFS
jgi:hypothetical protein